jgi:sugar phosphate isomerase/epimerase
MLKFGVCGDPKMALFAKEAGFDYFEWSVGDLLHPREGEEVFQAAWKEAQESGLPCPVVNVFIPADLKITGPEVDLAALEAFVKTALRRAETAGVDTIVFGSGGARRVPEGFPREKAWEQLVTFGNILGPIAQQRQVKIAVEPLNRSECNILNTVAEGARLVRQVDQPYFRLLVDGYHWAKDRDSTAGILDNADLLVHAHVATVDGRRPPNPHDPCSAFFSTMRQAGYTGRISIEGTIANPGQELPLALELMRAQVA